MLTRLSIRDIVLIDRLDLELEAGLCVLTGETGAGKSILLDALGLALGGRAERGLVREGAERGQAVAAFALPPDHPAQALLAEHDIEADDQLLLRRVVGRDGRSRAYVNDQPVGSALLRRLAALLVEVHGQHDQQGLVDGAVQRALLDAYGRLQPLLDALATAHGQWRAAAAEHAALAAGIEQAARDQAYWQHILGELDELAPEAGEEETLAGTRARLMHREKLLAALQEVLTTLRGEGGALETRLGRAQRSIERELEHGGPAFEAIAAALERTQVELEEAVDAVTRAGEALGSAEQGLEQVEERLFALRACARKHHCAIDDLPGLRAQTAARLASLDAGQERLDAAAKAAARERETYRGSARRLSEARARAAKALQAAVMAELPPLKLDKTRFVVRLAPLPEAEWSAQGAERVAFEVATNPGQAPGPLAKIASGGELARLMLALKVVLARTGATPCLVFDEVDAGIGGATAAAVGERLARLGRHAQVLVVTHAPQVAALADHHLQVAKTAARGRASVRVTALGEGERRDEIARMLAGATITDAARAAADSLLQHSA